MRNIVRTSQTSRRRTSVDDATPPRIPAGSHSACRCPSSIPVASSPDGTWLGRGCSPSATFSTLPVSLVPSIKVFPPQKTRRLFCIPGRVPCPHCEPTAQPISGVSVLHRPAPAPRPPPMACPHGNGRGGGGWGDINTQDCAQGTTRHAWGLYLRARKEGRDSFQDARILSDSRPGDAHDAHTHTRTHAHTHTRNVSSRGARTRAARRGAESSVRRGFGADGRRYGSRLRTRHAGLRKSDAHRPKTDQVGSRDWPSARPPCGASPAGAGRIRTRQGWRRRGPPGQRARHTATGLTRGCS